MSYQDKHTAIDCGIIVLQVCNKVFFRREHIMQFLSALASKKGKEIKILIGYLLFTYFGEISTDGNTMWFDNGSEKSTVLSVISK